MRIVFMGTPDFAVPVLETLTEHHQVVAVYCQPPRAAGRGKKPRPCPVQLRAEALGIPVHVPKSLRKTPAQADFAALNADVAVVAAYGLILPEPVLTAPRYGCLNVHASLLPRWRGAAPIQRAIMAGDQETGVTIMQMDAGLDTGAMLMSEAVPITDTTTAGQLHDTLAALGARLIVSALDDVAAGRAVPEPQPQDGVTYAEKIDKTEARLNFDRPAADVVRHIHGLSPFPGAFVEYKGERLKLLAAETVEGKGESGTILDGRMTVACAEGALRPVILQRAGRSPMAAADVLRGFDLPVGTRLA